MAKTNKVTVEYKDGITQEVEYPTKEEITRLNEEARKLADSIVSAFSSGAESIQVDDMITKVDEPFRTMLVSIFDYSIEKG